MVDGGREGGDGGVAKMCSVEDSVSSSRARGDLQPNPVHHNPPAIGKHVTMVVMMVVIMHGHHHREPLKRYTVSKGLTIARQGWPEAARAYLDWSAFIGYLIGHRVQREKLCVCSN